MAKLPELLRHGQGGALGIQLYGEIDDDNAAAFADALAHIEARPPQDVVPVYISSMGGDVYAGLKIVDLMDASPLPIDTVAVGQCMSAAALVFAFGRRRWVGPRATIMLHDVALSGIFDGHITDCEIETREARRLNSLMWRLMAERCGQPEDFFQSRSDKHRGDSYVTPEEALDIKLATHRGVPVLRTRTVLEVRPAGPGEEKGPGQEEKA